MGLGVKDWIQMAVVGCVAAMLLAWVVAPYSIHGESMAPYLRDGDVVLVYKLAYKIGKPKTGDAVIAITPYGVMAKRIAKTFDGNKYWLEGDNRNFSTDSREYGEVDGKNLIGPIGLRIWRSK